MRALVHPRLFGRLGLAFQRRVTIETYSVIGRSPTGAELRGWAALPRHTDMPAAISALSSQQRAAYASADVRIALQGYHPDITTAMRVRDLGEGAIYEIIAADHLYGQFTRLVVRSTGIGAEN